MIGTNFIQTSLFDYNALDLEDKIVVQQKTEEIKVLMRRTAQDVFDIGQKLSEIKTRLGHGHFGNWLKAEFEWSDRTAQNFIRVYESFKSENVSDLHFSQTALYVLAAAPEEARLEAIKLAKEKAIPLAEVKEIAQKHKIKSDPNPCLPNSTSVAATDAATPLPDCEAEKSDSSGLPNTTKTSSKSSNKDSPVPNSVETSTHLSGASGTNDPILSPAPLPASPLAYRETEKDQPTSETASPESLKSSTFSSHDTSPSKTSPESLAVLSDPEINQGLISLDYSTDWPKAGLMRNGNVSPQAILERPSNGKEYYLLPSPGALSSPNGTKQPGQTKLEAWLKEVGALSQKQVLNPEILEKAFALPLGWTDPWESRPAQELSATVGQDWGIVLTQELLEPQSIASSGSMLTIGFKQGEKVIERSDLQEIKCLIASNRNRYSKFSEIPNVSDLIGEVQSVKGNQAFVLWSTGESTNLPFSQLEPFDPENLSFSLNSITEFKQGEKVKALKVPGLIGEVQSVTGDYASVLWHSGEISNISVSELERFDPELKTGDRIKITGEITGKAGENLAVIRLDCGQVIQVPWSFVLPQ